MAQRHGPGDLIAITFDGDAVPSAVRSALDAALSSGVVELLDLLIVSRDGEGTLRAVEAEDLELEFDAAGLQLLGPGLIGADDIDEMAPLIGPGQTMMIALLEHSWARALTAAVTTEGGELVASERIPAWALDELQDLYDTDDPAGA